MKNETKPTFMILKGCGCLGTGNEAKTAPMKKPDFDVIENLIREIISAQTNLKTVYQFLEATKEGKVLFSKCTNGGEEITYIADWKYGAYGVEINFIESKVLTNENRNYMENNENFLALPGQVTFEPDAIENYPILDNEEEEETTEEQPLLYNEALFTRQYADEANEEQPMSQNGGIELK